MDSVEFECPECLQPLAVDNDALSATMRCEHCDHELIPQDAVGRQAAIPDEPTADGTPTSGPLPELGLLPEATRGSFMPPGERPSLRVTLYGRLDRDSTSLGELTSIAVRLTIHADMLRARRRGRLVVAVASLLTLALLTAMGLATGTWRWLLAAGAYLGVTGLLVWTGLRLLVRLPEHLGARELPGRAWKWLTALATVVTVAAAMLTWGLSEATASLAVAGWPQLARPRTQELSPSASATVARADALLKRGRHVRVADGVLYVPTSFASEDGAFDLIMHFHGNTDVVEQSVAAASVNALVHVTNLGDGSGPYEAAFQEPNTFTIMLDRIEQRAAMQGLRNAKVRRITLSSWSAGYGALFYILQHRRHRERIDAVLMMDSLHAKYRDEKTREILDVSVEPFVAFAKHAAGAGKLFVLTHSEVVTYGYANTTEASDAVLASLGARRNQGAAGKVSPHASIDAAILTTVPSNVRRDLHATGAAHLGNLHVLGYTGHEKEDHIAHLIHMSQTVLAPLAKHWK
jgi:hypothetical protein